jgi:hypothetical protein
VSRDYVQEVATEYAQWVAGALKAQRDGRRIHFVRYEDLHRDVELQRRQLYRFLDLDVEAAAPIQAGDMTRPGVGAPEDPMRFYRKGEVGDWRRYANGRFERWFLDSAGEALRALGY